MSFKKKIRIIIGSLNVGGTEKQLVQILNGLYKKNWNIEIITITNIGELAKRLNKNIKISDPLCKFNILKYDNFEIKDNLKKFDLILLCVKHKQYRSLNANLFSKKTVIMDLNNVLDKNQIKSFKNKKFRFHTLGNNAT